MAVMNHDKMEFGETKVQDFIGDVDKLSTTYNSASADPSWGINRCSEIMIKK